MGIVGILLVATSSMAQNGVNLYSFKIEKGIIVTRNGPFENTEFEACRVHNEVATNLRQNDPKYAGLNIHFYCKITTTPAEVGEKG